MQRIGSIINQKQWGFWKKEWDLFEFVNHGMGFLRKEEHEDLLKHGGITCKSGVDSVNAEYPLVKITKPNGENQSIDVGGKLFQVKEEVASLQRQGKNAKIAFYPKYYSEHIEKRWPFVEHKTQEEIDLEKVIESF
jgi:hypothetical protein